MIKTRAGMELLRFLATCSDGDVIDRDWLRTYINRRLPRQRTELRSARQVSRAGRSTSDGSAASKHLNSALRELEVAGVLVRGAANCVVIQDVSQVPSFLEQTQAHFNKKKARHR